MSGRSQTPRPLNPGPALQDSGPVIHWFFQEQGRQELSAAPRRAGDGSILDNYQPLDRVSGLKTQGLDLSIITEVASATGHEVAVPNRRFGPSCSQTAIY